MKKLGLKMDNRPEYYLKMALELAKQGLGSVAPNPMVGAVIVKDGRIIGRGLHKKYGGAHAEVDAVNNATESVEGATLYCSLEPCCHTKKQTPPCTDLVIKSKFKEVYVCTLDPNPQVAGKGLKILEQAGIKTFHGYLEKEACELNKVFFHFIKAGLPYVHLKWAQTLDGKLATSSGDSKWITSELSRKRVHELRSLYSSIMIGSETLKNDNPKLTTRINNNESCPLRIVVGSEDKINKKLNLFTDQYKDKTLIFDTKGIQVKSRDILNYLAEKKITSVFIEGGGQLLSTFINEGQYQEISVFIAPRILGSGKEILPDRSVPRMSETINFDSAEIEVIENEVVYHLKKTSDK